MTNSNLAQKTPQRRRIKRKIKAITFDFWETLYTDLYDVEQQRKAARLDLLRKYIIAKGKNIAEDALVLAYTDALRFLGSQSLKTRVPFGLFDIIVLLLTRIEVEVSVHRAEIAELSDTMDRLCLEFPPVMIRDALQTLQAIRGSYLIALISNTGETSGKVLRELMARDGLLDHFTHCSFSDEVGGFKPDALIFNHTISRLAVPASATVHIGNEVPADVEGARNAGLQAILVNFPFAAPLAPSDLHKNYLAIQDFTQLESALQKFETDHLRQPFSI